MKKIITFQAGFTCSPENQNEQIEKHKRLFSEALVYIQEADNWREIDEKFQELDTRLSRLTVWYEVEWKEIS